MVRGAAAAVAALLVPATAHAFALLRLFEPGDAPSVARGGEPFRDLSLEADLLEQPARLTEKRERRLWSRLSNEYILEIKRERFAGTSADDRQLGLSLQVPFEVEGHRVTLAASGRNGHALSRLLDHRNSLTLEMNEAELAGAFAASGDVVPWLAVGASAQLTDDAGPGWLAQVRASPLPWAALSFAHGASPARYTLETPGLQAKKLALPAMSYEIVHSLAVDELLLELGDADTGHFVGSVDFNAHHRLYLEARTPDAVVVARAAFERQTLSLTDYVHAEGIATLARANLGLDQTRLLGGLDVHTPVGLFRTRATRWSLDSSARVRELGNSGSQAVLDGEVELDLFAGSGYQLEARQVSAGYERALGKRVTLAVNAQLMRVSAAGGLRYGAAQLDLTGEEDLATTHVLLAGAGGGVQWQLTPHTRLAASLVQLVPVSYETEVAPPPFAFVPPTPAPDEPPPPAPTPAPAPAPAPSAPQPDVWTRLRTAARSYGGGNLVLFELSQQF